MFQLTVMVLPATKEPLFGEEMETDGWVETELVSNVVGGKIGGATFITSVTIGRSTEVLPQRAFNFARVEGPTYPVPRRRPF